MTAFERAFALLKIDTGMWEEIYAPLLAETTGMGEKQNANFITDFVPTSWALDNIRARYFDPEWRGGDMVGAVRGNHGDHGNTVEQLMESILEHGYDTRGMERSGRNDPTFEWSLDGVDQYEGNHRLVALDELGAPYVPYMGYYSRGADEGKHLHDFGSEMSEVLQAKAPYSLSDYMKRGWRMPTPPSYLYGRELIPGKGRLVPVDYEGNQADLLSHIDDISYGHQYLKRPAWQVIHDE